MRISIYPNLSRSMCLWTAACLPVSTLAQAEGCVVSLQPPQLQAGQSTPAEAALPLIATPHAAVHGQLLYGENTFYLSHLAVFMGESHDHPHNFQVVLEVAFADPAAEAAYVESRRAAPGEVFTAVPLPFDQMTLVTEEPGRRIRRTLPDTSIVKGHFEQGGRKVIPPAELNLERVVYFREFVTGGERLDRPEYLLFGRSDEVFLTHLISAPPDFQQVLKVDFTREGNTQDILPAQLDALLAEGLFLTLPDRANAAAARLRPGEMMVCSVDDADARLPVAAAEIRVVEELYCEEGELSALVMKRFNDPAHCIQ